MSSHFKNDKDLTDDSQTSLKKAFYGQICLVFKGINQVIYIPSFNSTSLQGQPMAQAV